MIDFVGIGAERAGTSWVYACLYEHPEICAPIKEIHFFSRDRYAKGVEWYVKHFARCENAQLRGEYSTSYLYSEVAAGRIRHHFPEVKIIVVLRNPIDRVFSQYRNEIAAGHVRKSMTFEEFIDGDSEGLQQGQYSRQIRRYLKLFPREQIYIKIYEDGKKDPEKYIANLYTFLGVDSSFQPSLLHRKVNTSRTPSIIGVDRIMIRIADALRKSGLDRIVWAIKKSGIPKLIRRVNTDTDEREMKSHTRKRLQEYYRDDVAELSQLLDRDLNSEWNI